MGCLWSKHREAPVSAPEIPEPEQANAGMEWISSYVSVFPRPSCNVVDVVVSRCILVRFSLTYIYHSANQKPLILCIFWNLSLLLVIRGHSVHSCTDFCQCF